MRYNHAYNFLALKTFILFSVWILIKKDGRCTNLDFKSVGNIKSLGECIAYCQTNGWKYFVYGYCNQDTCQCIYYIDEGKECIAGPWSRIDLYKLP